MLMLKVEIAEINYINNLTYYEYYFETVILNRPL